MRNIKEMGIIDWLIIVVIIGIIVAIVLSAVSQ